MESKANSERILAVNAVKEKIKKGEYILAAQFVHDTDNKYEFPLALKKKALSQGAKCHLQRYDFESAFFLYNHLHKVTPQSKTTFKNLISVLDKIWDNYESIVGANGANYFTVDDTEIFLTSISMLINYHLVKFPEHRIEIEEGKQLLKKVNYIKKYKAIESEDPNREIESAVSFRIKKIYDAIYEEMTLEQVYQEAARILAPSIRDYLSDKEKESETEQDKSVKKKKKKPNKK